MNLDITFTLSDEEGQPSLAVSSCHEDHLVSLTTLSSNTVGSNVIVHIDDLRLALRKLTTK